MESQQKQGGIVTTEQWRVIELANLGVLRVGGADAVPFLQGQLSNDVARLSAGQSQLAGYHNPQGRAIAVLRLVRTASADVLAILPRELVKDVAARLRKYILRSKVVLTEESDAWRLHGLVMEDAGADKQAADIPSQAGAGVALPAAAGMQVITNESIAVRIDDVHARWLVVTPQGSADPLAVLPRASLDTWTALDIAAGIPQVYAATAEAFVAQMLNLDAVGAIAFDKGCYTGQEVIARAHYRGRVKRRMQRFLTDAPASLSRGDSGTLNDGRSFKVVESLQRPDGRVEFLAVTNLSAGDDEGTGPGAAEAAVVRATALPLPYELPQ
jgi:tRNA-modifying protein YgfZ